MVDAPVDVLLVGGGLANGLIAWRLRQARPELRILLVERGPTLGGNHTWSYYHPDLTPAQHAWLAPLVVRCWPGYEVRFPEHRRRLSTPCYSISADRFHEVLMQALGDAVLLDAMVDEVGATGARINGAWQEAGLVIDGRGHAASPHMRYAWQKFVGREVLLRQPHGQALPIIMDATVPQDDGYRFVYTLPFDERRILVEDTYYSGAPGLDEAALRRRIDDYIAARGWQVERVEREESGVLPIALSGDIERFWRDKPAHLACSGLRAGLFHATTGYSLPFAARLADEVAALPALSEAGDCIRARSIAQWRGQLFMRLLNRMLFFASAPAQRYRLLQRFYGLPQARIERFYAARLNWADKLRILSGKPPVPLGAAFMAMANIQRGTSSKPS